MKTSFTKNLQLAIVLSLAFAVNFAKAQTCTASFNYSVNPNGNVTFTANAVPANSINTAYYWNFYNSNGSYITSQSYTGTPTTTYSFAGNACYVVYLMVWSSAPTCSVSYMDSVCVNTSTAPCNLNAGFVPYINPNNNTAVTFSNASTGAAGNTTYSWNFGDGNTSNLGSPTHTYALSGTYIVTLTASTPNYTPACSSTYTLPVTISSQTCNLNANFSLNQSSNGAVQFNNSSTGTSGGVTYSWNFGDGGTSISASPAHTYAANGTYTVTLTANNNFSYTCSSVKNMVIVVNSICNLNANFTYTNTSNGLVFFTNTTTGGPATYTWSFGNGNTSTSTSPSHNYVSAGYYVVTLTAKNSSSLMPTCIDTVSHGITITNTCVANTTFSLMPAGTPHAWYAVVTNTANVAAAMWSWGDSTANSMGIVNSHTYSTAGNYNICLTVTMTCGAIGTHCSNQYLSKTAGESADIVFINCVTPDMLPTDETGIKANSADNVSFVVSPNPNGGEFNINLNGLNSSDVKIQVYNLVGELILENSAETHNGTLMQNIKMENAASGLYFIKVNADGNIHTQKVIISK